MSLILQNLGKSYPTRSGDLSVLRDINLTLEDGEALAILGPSGSGKSTLLYILGTLDRPSAGSYQLGGRAPFALTDVEVAHFRNRCIGFVFQDHHLLPQCSVLENVLIPTLAGGRGSQTIEAIRAHETRARQLLDRVGLSQRLEHRPAELSGGERQRVALARAVLADARILIFDEATSSLDSISEAQMQRALEDVIEDRTTIIVAHRLSTVQQVDRILVFDQGRIVEQGTHTELLAREDGYYRRLFESQALGLIGDAAIAAE